MNTMNLLDDNALIKQYIEGKARFSFNQNLRVEQVSDKIQLLSRKGLLLATIDAVSQIKVIFVRQETSYWESINQVLLENHLMPTGQLENGMMRYEYHPIPIGYQVSYAETRHLWQLWRSCCKKTNSSAKLNILVFNSDGWQPIKEMAVGNESIFIKTFTDEMVIHISDRIAWLYPNQEAEPAVINNHDKTVIQNNFIADKKEIPNTSEIVSPNSIWNQLPEDKNMSKNLPPQVPAKNKNILNIYQGKLYIQTIEGEIVVEGTSLKFWFSPPEGQNIIPQPVEVK